MIKIMDKIWLDAGMDFRMNAYRVTPTEDQVGMIEIV
jgi:phosphatidylinositol-4,5-bisphosphate 3-kinase catalytic subunit alpha/beta/delta